LKSGDGKSRESGNRSSSVRKRVRLRETEKTSFLEVSQAVLGTINSRQLLQQLLKSDSQLELQQLISLFKEARQEQDIPLTIFSYNLGPVQAICKYLKENKQFSYREIGAIIHRNEKSVWATYTRAKKETKLPFILKNEKYSIPISLFKDRNYSVMEIITWHLYQVYHLNTKEMGQLLHCSPNSAAVLLKRARDKHEQ